MSWKSLDQIYTENTAFKPVTKLPRQQVYNEATPQEIIDLIKDLDSKDLLSDEGDLEYIKRFLSQKPYTNKISQYLTNQNLTPTTISEGDVQVMIMDILSRNGDIETYANYIDNPSALTAVGNSGMLIANIQQVSGLKESTIRELINLIGTESGRGVGRAEIALATIFNDVGMSKSKGDLDWSGEYLEVKGTSARLGKRDRASANFIKTNLGILAQQFDKSDKRIDTLVSNISNEEGANRTDLFNALNDFVKDEYPHSSMDLPSDLNMSNPLAVRKALTKIYFNNYAEHEGVDSFIFVNTSRNRYFSRYIIFTKEQIPQLIDGNLVKSGVITTLDLDPSLGTI